MFVIIVIHSYFTYISQGSVYSKVGYIITTLLQPYNNHIITNCLRNVSVKKF